MQAPVSPTRSTWSSSTNVPHSCPPLGGPVGLKPGFHSRDSGRIFIRFRELLGPACLFTERTLRLCAISRKNWLFVGSDQGGETAAVGFSILAGAKRHRIQPLAHVRALLIALSSGDVDLESLLPDVWIKVHPEHFLKYRRDEAEAGAIARRRRRARRRANAPGRSRSP